jgi:hypothetical protein
MGRRRIYRRGVHACVRDFAPLLVLADNQGHRLADVRPPAGTDPRALAAVLAALLDVLGPVGDGPTFPIVADTDAGVLVALVARVGCKLR